LGFEVLIYIFGFQAYIAYNIEGFPNVSAKSAVAVFRVNVLGVPEIAYTRIGLAVSNDCEFRSSGSIQGLQVTPKRKDLILKMIIEISVEMFEKFGTLRIAGSLGFRNLFNNASNSRMYFRLMIS
jgi:hypothetical protein